MVWNYTAKLQKGRLCHHPSSYRCLGCRLTLPRSGPWNIHTTVFSIPQSQKLTKCSRRERKCSLLGSHMAINCNKKLTATSSEVAVPHSLEGRERKVHRMYPFTQSSNPTEWTILFSNLCSKTNCKRAGVQIRRGHQCARGDLRSGDPHGHLRTVAYVLCGAGKLYFHSV